MNTSGVIYGLFSPSSGELRYIGKTKNDLTSRVKKHMFDARTKQSYCAKWLRSLGDSQPLVAVLDVVLLTEIDDAERRWIADMRAAGVRLTNTLDGGDGAIVSRSPAVSDEVVLQAYAAGVTANQISKDYKTCKKRVLTVLGNHGVAIRGIQRPVQDDLGNTFPSLLKAANHYGVHSSAIHAALNGKAKTSCGRKFKYVDG